MTCGVKKFQKVWKTSDAEFLISPPQKKYSFTYAYLRSSRTGYI